MLLDCAWKSISPGGNRVFNPVMLRYKSQNGKGGTDFKAYWVQKCL